MGATSSTIKIMESRIAELIEIIDDKKSSSAEKKRSLSEMYKLSRAIENRLL
jgi:hypothetical protein